MFRGFFDDPFFGFNEHQRRRRMIEEIEDNRGHHHSNDSNNRNVAIPDHFGHDSMLSFMNMRDPFSMFDNMMSNMRGMIDGTFSESLNTENNDGFGYSSVSVSSYSNDGSGKPRIFQAHSSTKHAPGGVKETHKALRDTDIGLEKMAIGRHIKDRGHVITRERDTRNGHLNENQDFIGFKEEEVPMFDDEWSRATKGHKSKAHLFLKDPPRPTNYPALEGKSLSGKHKYHNA